MCLAVFSDFPVWNPAGTACTAAPFVPEPSCCATVSRIAHHKRFTAEGRDSGCCTMKFHGPDPMKNTSARRPQTNLVDQLKKLRVFPVKTLPLMIFPLRRNLVRTFPLHRFSLLFMRSLSCYVPMPEGRISWRRIREFHPAARI